MFTVLVYCCGCHNANHRREWAFAGETQGTTYSVKIVGDDLSEEHLQRLQHAVTARLNTVDRTLSNYRPDSELARFNAFRDTAAFQASPDLVEVFGLAREVSAATGGAFDVTIAPLVNLWGFGPRKTDERIPSDEEIDLARQRVDYRNVDSDAVTSTLRKHSSDIQCDLNAIAQGYTVDKVAADLETLGCTDYLIEIGGEVRARGHNAGGDNWRIGIEKPLVGQRALDRVVFLDNRALSTSGDYRKYYEKDGLRVSHTIDPQTGRPIAHRLASVSVIHERCAIADAYATALMVLGPEKGCAFAESMNIPALFIIHDDANGFTETMTESFAAALTPSS